MKKATLADRLRYRFDNLMSRGTIALVGVLFAITFALVLAATLVLVLARIRPEGSAQALSLGEALWQTTMRTIDTGTVAGDTGWSFRIVGIIVTFGGIFITSALIGVLASGLEGRMGDLRRGRSRVIETGHTVILGWSPQVITIVSELAHANRSLRSRRTAPDAEGRSPCVVILADRDKVEMEEEIHTKVPDTMGTRVVCRSGTPLDLDDLKIVNPDTARAIIVVSPGGQYPDLPVAKSMMALAKDRDRRTKPYHIVAAIHRPANREIFGIIGGDEAQVFMVDRLISHLIAQACHQPGLSAVYGELFSFQGAAIYFREERGLIGVTYGQALFRYEDSALIGLQYRDGRSQINPPMDTVIQAGDKLIAITADDDTIRPSGRTDFEIRSEAVRDLLSPPAPLERVLILGWNRRGPTIAEQLSYYAPPGFELRIVAPFEPQAMQADCAAAQFHGVRVTFEQGNLIDRPTLEKLAAAGYATIVILSTADAAEPQLADASTIITLLHLRDIAKKRGQPVSIISEILDVQNRDLAEVTNADDVVISERLVALAMTQIAEDKDVVPVFVDLLSPSGNEIYLKPAADYVEPGLPVNFYTVLEAARRKGETAIGYRLLAEASEPEQSFGVHLNPNKGVLITFREDDRVIVVATQ
jgi:Trk K+ transport system NAD-binding subunit